MKFRSSPVFSFGLVLCLVHLILICLYAPISNDTRYLRFHLSRRRYSTLNLLEKTPQAIGTEAPLPAFVIELFRSVLAKDNALIFMPEILDIYRTYNAIEAHKSTLSTACERNRTHPPFHQSF